LVREWDAAIAKENAKEKWESFWRFLKLETLKNYL
jgi:hypothetical protein